MTTDLRFGDAVDVFRSIRGLNSIVSQHEVNPSVFNGVMTRRAKTDEVAEIMRLVRGWERPDGFDVVDVERLPARDDFAAPARSTVTSPRRALCRAPIWAVVLWVSAAPSGFVGSLSEGVATRERTEGLSCFSDASPARVLESRPAFGADDRAKHAHTPELLRALPMGLPSCLSDRVGPRDNALRGARRAALVVACSRAEHPVLGPLELRGCALDKGTAHPARMRRFRAAVGGRYGCIAAISRARLLESDLDSVLRGAERSAAHLARCINHLGHVGSVTHERSGRK